MQPTNLKAVKNVKAYNQKGFTLIELLSIMVIMSVMVSVGIKKFEILSDNAGITALRTGNRELNTRETLTWFKIKLSETGYSTDEDVYNAVDKNIGSGYSWNPAPNTSGGRLYFKSRYIDLTRIASTSNSPSYWE
jgi:prepilin-type N-terminal cleavage/methylation domain-containing protein